MATLGTTLVEYAQWWRCVDTQLTMFEVAVEAVQGVGIPASGRGG